MSRNASFRVVVVAPVFDDAASASRLLKELHQVFSSADLAVQVLLVDDGSPVPIAAQLAVPEGLLVKVLRLTRNVGHQRALSLGIAHVHDHKPCNALVVMDADGEDRPQDALKLIERCRKEGGSKVIFAERTRRSESLLFQVLYRLYQAIHWLLTGIRVKVGNFSVIPSSLIGSVVTLPSMWNHYAAAIFQAHLPRELVPTARGHRYFGRSKMNLTSLVIHGLQAISVFIEIVAVRLLLLLFFLAVFCMALIAASVIAPTSETTPLFLTGVLAVILALGLGFFSLALGLLAQRNRMDFIPCRDYCIFVQSVTPVMPRKPGLPASPDMHYVGGELEIFSHALNWKAYWISKLRPYLTGSVLEVGAGIGANTRLLMNGESHRWVCLEPDAKLADQLRHSFVTEPSCSDCEVWIGTVGSIVAGESFDTILYIDVLEHIEDDATELQRAAARLNPDGSLIVLSPAHHWLFSEFDRSIGHHRRYTRATLSALNPPGLQLARCFYLDSVGLLASAANRCLLRQPLPTPKQISLWDNTMIPCSRVLDPLTGHSVGKTVVAIWKKPA